MTKAKLNQIQIRNYKNIASAVVNLQPLTILIGPNGAGKSNFTDALSFVADSLTHSLKHAFAYRGGVAAVRHISGGHPTHIGIRLSFILADGASVDYAFEIAAHPQEPFRVTHERCVVVQSPLSLYEYEIVEGEFTREVEGIRPRLEPDRLALTAIADVKEFRPVFDFLTNIRPYNLQPKRLRDLQDPDPEEGKILASDGRNTAAVLRRIKENDSPTYQRICRLLGKVVPGISGVEPKSLGPKETLEFRQAMKGQRHPWTFYAENMSDGTLRILAILLAVYQPQPASLIIIEEPETAIHPAAAEILMDILLDGAERSQVLITTHSPDVLDNKRLLDKQIVAVESIEGTSQITPLAATTREVIQRHLCTPGELLRSGELEPDRDYADQSSRQLRIFGDMETESA